MKITEKDIEIARGDSFPIEVTLTGLGSITGYTFTLTVTSISAPSDDSSKVFDVAGVVTDGPNGVVTFTPTSTDTATVGSLFYDVQMVGGGANPRTVLRGRFIIRQDRSK